MDQSDLEATRLLRREFNRRHIDISLADLRVMHGIAYIRGTLSCVGGVAAGHTAKEEIDHVIHMLRGRSEIRDVVLDANIRG